MRALMVIALLFCTFPAWGGETPWQQVAPGVQLRLISSGKIKPDGTTLVGVEIDMPANTKTYWRVAGDTGFPMQLDFAGSTGIERHRIIWPYPKRDEKANYLDYVYYGPTVLPILLDTGSSAPELVLSTVLGVCSDICVPAQAQFSLPLAEPTPDMANSLRLKQAVALAPISWPADEPAFGPIMAVPPAKQLLVPIRSDAIDTSSIIVTTAAGELLFGTPQKSREPNLVVVPILSEDNNIDWSTHQVELTFTTDQGAFETTVPVQTGAVEQ